MKRILIAPLDWGLGHATRCIPIIRLALSRGHSVSIASSGSALQLLKAEFPFLPAFELPPYAPAYSRRGSMVWKMGLQLPKFLQAISAEHKEIENIVKYRKFDAVISDNRYGCWSQQVPSVFITHQSNVMMPKRFGWLSRWVRMANENAMNNFSTCWIPDYPNDHSLAGELISFGHLKYKGVVEYIGALSRFNYKNAEPGYDVVAICSGPEPQRTLLEQVLKEQLGNSGRRYLLVRGVFDETGAGAGAVDRQGPIINYLTTDELQEILPGAGCVVARSGYSTIMDMQALRKKVIFIPTPGQTEQEYLAYRLMEKGIAYFMKQHEFNLAHALKEFEKYTGFTDRNTEDSYLVNAFSKLERQL